MRIYLCENVINGCAGDREAAYAFLYPNLMVNRYGPWMDTNIVTLTGPESCIVRFDWWLEEHLCHDSALTEQSLADSEQVSRNAAVEPAYAVGAAPLSDACEDQLHYHGRGHSRR